MNITISMFFCHREMRLKCNKNGSDQFIGFIDHRQCDQIGRNLGTLA